MARKLDISPAYVNLLESNQRSLSVKVLVAITDAYGVDWRQMLGDVEERLLPELRAAMRDPVFHGDPPDLQELRAAIDHAPRLSRRFLQVYQNYRTIMERLDRISASDAVDVFSVSPETALYRFFRDHMNYFDDLERLSHELRQAIGGRTEDLYSSIKRHLRVQHEVDVAVVSIDEMPETLRHFDRDTGRVLLSEALDHPNRIFQLAHVLGLLTCQDVVDDLVAAFEQDERHASLRLSIELMNYFAGAFVLPYDEVLSTAEETGYDLDRIASKFGTNFEQVCHRLTTLQRDGARGIPFFMLRIDRAGNVTKRFNTTPFVLAELGGSCPVWGIHSAFRQPGLILPQFVELPDGGRFFTLFRTADRPVFSRTTQDRQVVVGLGCELTHAKRICYARHLPSSEPTDFAQIGTNCHVCPRSICEQRAHQPLNTELRLDADRRGRSRYST